jgi:hypothetical protein
MLQDDSIWLHLSGTEPASRLGLFLLKSPSAVVLELSYLPRARMPFHRVFEMLSAMRKDDLSRGARDPRANENLAAQHVERVRILRPRALI